MRDRVRRYRHPALPHSARHCRAPFSIRNHPVLQSVLQDVDLPNTGVPSHPVTMVTKTLLITAEARPDCRACTRSTSGPGERLGTVALPASGKYGMMSYQREGRQYIVVQSARSSARITRSPSPWSAA